MSKRRGLALIYKPSNLLQFIWYYCTYDSETEWDALCLPNGYSGQFMDSYCEKSELFKNVLKDTKSYVDMPLSKQVGMFSKMLLCALVGQQKRFYKKTACEFADIESYDRIVVPCDIGIVSGAFVGLGGEYDVTIMEDGTADYLDRKLSNVFTYKPLLSAIRGSLMSVLGYANTDNVFPLRTNKRCVKYCSRIEKMKYRDYKEMRQLFDFSKTDMELYNSVIARLYNGISDYDFSGADTILFTAPFEADFINDFSPYLEKLKSYIAENSKSVIIKKHPRDAIAYDFGENVKTAELDSEIPAEVILPYIKDKTIILTFPSSTLLNIPQDYNIKLIYFDGMHEVSKKQNTRADYADEGQFKTLIDMFGIDNPEIIKL